MKKLSNYLKDDEIITLAELYKRVYGKSGSYCALAVFDYQTVQKDKSIVIIPYTESSPMMIKKRKTFLKKMLDILKYLCYNKYTKEREVHTNGQKKKR